MRETLGTPRDFAAEGFEPKDHLDLGEGLDALDMARGAKVWGRASTFSTASARAWRWLCQPRDAAAVEAGFVPMITPDAGHARR